MFHCVHWEGLSATLVEIKAGWFEVNGFEGLKAWGKEKIQGKHRVFNITYGSATTTPFSLIEVARTQRIPVRPTRHKYGAVGYIVRSYKSTVGMLFPHTGQ